MSGETPICIVGNLTEDPDLRFVPQGDAVVTFTVASTPREYDRQSQQWRDGATLFLRCQQWRQPGENVAQSLRKGDRVIVSGSLGQRSYQTREGDKRTVIEVQADEVGVALRYATATPQRNPRASGTGVSGDRYAQPEGGQRDQWAAAGQGGHRDQGGPADYSDDSPF